MLQIELLKRNDNILEDMVAEIGDTLVAKNKCSIVIPYRFIQAGLLELGKTIYCCTVFPIVNEDNQYTVSNVLSKLELTPSSIEITKYKGEEHYVFIFDKGSVICPNLNLIMDGDFSYLIFDEIIQKAKAPWFMNYKDVGKLMSTASSHAGIWLSDTNAIFELIVASLSRNSDLSKYYREEIETLDAKELTMHKREPIPLVSITYSAINKMNKLMGGYFEDGLTSALTENKSPHSGVEELLRKQ